MCVCRRADGKEDDEEKGLEIEECCHDDWVSWRLEEIGRAHV